MAIEFTDQNFQSEAMADNTVSVVDFWAPWCGPCRLVSPIIYELSGEYNGKVKIGKLNVDDNPQVSLQFGIRSIPTIMFIKNGQVVEKHVGTATKANLKSKIDSML